MRLGPDPAQWKGWFSRSSFVSTKEGLWTPWKTALGAVSQVPVGTTRAPTGTAASIAALAQRAPRWLSRASGAGAEVGYISN